MRFIVFQAELHIPHAESLKDRRRVVRRLKAQLKERFNIALAEVDADEKWQRASLGGAMVNGEGEELNRELSRLRAFLESREDCVLSDFQIVSE